MPTKKVDCLLVTSHLKQFLEDYPPSSDKQAFLDNYHMLSLLDKYLYDNPKQHTHCMSLDNEYVTLLKYAIHLNIDLTTFPTLWAVLSILFDTQDGKCQHVKCLQEEYNTYYEDKSRDYMLKLEEKSVEIQNCMHDSVTQNFDRVSGICRATTWPPRSSSTAECLRLIARLKKVMGIYGLLETLATV